MKRLYQVLLILLIALAIGACSTGKSAYNKGNYYDATMKAVRHLRSNPDSKKSLALVQKSYPMALNYHRQQVDAMAASNHPDKYLRIVEEYELMNSMADEITRCPPALEVLRPVVYFHDQQKKAELMAINEQYSNAKKLMSNGNISDAQLAYRRLQWIKQKQPNFSGIDQQLAIAKDLATLKVVVEHFSEMQKNYNIDSRVFYSRLYDQLVRSSGYEFIRFYQPALAEELSIKPHEVVSVQFLEFTIGAIRDHSSSNSYKSDSVVVGSYTDNDGNVFDVKGSVSAKVEQFEREVVARGILSITITDFHSNEIIQSRKYPGDYIWRNQWATFNGDERALPKNIKALTKEKQRMPPSPQEIFLLFSEPLYQNASSFLKSYYSKRY